MRISPDAAFVTNSEYRAPPSGGIAGMYRAEIGVRDSSVAAQVPGFDGRETPFALVPKNVGNVNGQTVYEWEAVAGTYDYSKDGVDYYKFEARRFQDDLGQGVAFGMNTNASETIWLQDPGAEHNFQAPLTGYGF